MSSRYPTVNKTAIQSVIVLILSSSSLSLDKFYIHKKKALHSDSAKYKVHMVFEKNNFQINNN